MRPGNLSPDATVVTTVLLGLSLVDVSHPLSLVPCHLLGSVDSFDLVRDVFGYWLDLDLHNQ